MNFDELKNGWQQAGAATGAATPLQDIISTRKHLAVTRRVQVKLLVEAIAMALLLFVFYDFFDGDKKPVYASLVLVLGALFYFLSNLLGYFKLQQLVRDAPVASSLQQQLLTLKQLKAVSLVAMLFFALSLLLFFTSAIVFDLKRLLLLIPLVAVVLVQEFLAMRMWNGWISKTEQLVHELAA